MGAQPSVASDPLQGLSAQAWSEIQQVIERFDDAWQCGQHPQIDQYILADDPRRFHLLVQLALVDLEHSLKSGVPARVETYFDRYPELASTAEVALELIAAEYELRCRSEPAPAIEEYFGRFPQYQMQLVALLHLPSASRGGLSVANLGESAEVASHGVSAVASKDFDVDIADFAGTKRFKILRRIGNGAMGDVYEACDLRRNTNVALKVLRHLGAHSVERFKQEFRALAGVSHPNLVAFDELFMDGDRWFFTMELIDGVDFLTYVRPSTPPGAGTPHEPPLSAGGLMESASPVQHAPKEVPSAVRLDRLRATLGQLALGVSSLHAAGKLHRDIKPSNVLVTEQERVVLLDFGLAAVLDQQGQHLGSGVHVVGTANYMSPEQAARRTLSPASDWYSVGVMLYESLTGRCPFSGGLMDVLVDKQRLEPVAPGELAPGVPEDLNELCVQLLRREPTSRAGGQEILHYLAAATAESLAPSGRAASPDSRTPLVGRDTHLKELADALAAMKRGGTVAVWVHGRSGVGKSALVERFLGDLVEQRKAVVLTDRCFERESVPFKASLVEALSRYLRGLLRPEVESLMPRDVRALRRVFPVLRSVPAVAAAPGRMLETPDRLEMRRRAFAALRELFARLGDRLPLVLHIDDLQWGDQDSAALLSDLLQPPDPPRLLLIGSYRSEDAATSPCLRVIRQTLGTTELDQREIEVQRLNRSEARELALALLAPEDGEKNGLADAIAQESDGNPFFLYELVRYVKERPRLEQQMQSPVDLTLNDVLWARARLLPEAPSRLLQVLAVAGQPLSQQHACRAAQLAGQEQAAVNALRSAQFIRMAAASEQDRLETYHDRIREALVARLSAAALADLHNRLALVLEDSDAADAETLAVHYHAAGSGEKAGEYYARAASEAAEILAFDRAAKLYRLSLELRAVHGFEECTLRTKLGDALANSGRGAEAAKEYVAAASATHMPAAAQLQGLAAMQWLISGHIDEGLAALRAALQSVGLRLPATPRQALWSLLVQRLSLRLRGTSFRECDASQVPADMLSRVDILWSASVGLSMVDPLCAASLQAHHLRSALRAGEVNRVARALSLEAFHTSVAGGPAQRRTAKLLDAANTLAERVAQPHTFGLVALVRGSAAFCEGRWKAAREWCDNAEKIFRDQCTGVTWELNTVQWFGVVAHFFTGEIGDLTRRFPAILREAQERNDLFYMLAVLRIAHTLVALAADDVDQARNRFSELKAQYSRQGFFFHQSYLELLSDVYADLYAEDGNAAWRRITRDWSAVARSHLLRIQEVRLHARFLRASSALAAACRAADPRPLLRAAERDARRIEREHMPWSDPLVQLTRAAAADLRGDNARAIQLLTAAIAGFDANDMALCAAAARRRLGTLLGGDEGRQLTHTADSWMLSQQIKNPGRMTAMMAPGFRCRNAPD